jgi:transposase
MKKRFDLSNAQWQLVEPLFTWDKKRNQRRGRPPREARQVLDGVLWVLRTGAPWYDVPERYGPYQTCHRRFQQWVREGVLEGVLWALAEDLRARGKLDLAECFIDASFVEAKKGALQSVRQRSARGARSWQLQTAMALLSPYGLQVLRRMSANWSKTPCAHASSPQLPSE